jgi:replicative DNA helicase
MIIDRTALERAREILRPDDFYREAHQRIFEAAEDLAERSEPVDLITLSDALRVRNHLEQVGGIAYLATLADIVPTTANVEYYAQIVEHKAILRRLINVSQNITGWCYDGGEDADTIVDRAEHAIFEVGKHRMGESFVPLKQLVTDSWDSIEKAYENTSDVIGVDTGFRKFNNITTGLQPSDFIIIAARPSMGKTAFALSIATNAAHAARRRKQPFAVAIFSLEMSKEQLALRMITSEARVNSHRLRTGRLHGEDWGRIANAVESLSELSIYIDDTTDISPMQMRAKCRRLAATDNLGLVIIDYLQLIRSTGRTENRNQEITAIARSLKAMAKELKVPVVALSQLSRAVERRDDRKPMLSDLRDSGSIEAEADLVAFLYREDYYKKKDARELSKGDTQPEEVDRDPAHNPPGERPPEVTEVIVAKHRNGPVGTIKLQFISNYARFENLVEDEEEPPYGG